MTRTRQRRLARAHVRITYRCLWRDSRVSTPPHGCHGAQRGRFHMSVEHAETAENGPAIPTESTALIEPVEAIETVDSVTTAEATLTATTYYSIAPGYSVNVRSGPGTNYSIVRVL